MEDSLARIEAASGVSRRTGESPGEYVDRVAATAGVDGELARRTVAELEGATRRPGVEPDRRVIEALLDAVSDTGAEGTHDDPGESIDALRDRVSRLESALERRESPSAPRHPDGSWPDATGASDRARSPAVPLPFDGGVRSVSPRLSRYVAAVFDARDVYYLCAILLAGWLVFFRSLGDAPLVSMDEGIYATAAANMLYYGDLLVPHVNWLHGGEAAYRPFLEKPPLVLWLQALSMRVFGVTAFAARFPSAVGATLSGIAVYLFGREMRDRTVGILAVVVLFTTVGFYTSTHAGRRATTDALFVFGGIVFLLVVWKLSTDADPSPAAYTLLGVVTAFVLLVKGFATGIFVVVAAPLVVSSWDRFASRRLLRAAGVALLLVLPWPLLMFLLHGQAFVEQILVHQVLERIVGHHPADPEANQALFGFMRYPYVRSLPRWGGPWLFYVVAGVGYLSATLVPDGWSRELRDFGFLVWWFVSILAFFAVTGENFHYILPLFPAGALIVAWTLVDAVRGDWRASIAVGGGTMLTAYLTLVHMDLSMFHVLGMQYFEYVSEEWYQATLLVLGTVGVVSSPLVARYWRGRSTERDRDLARTWIPIAVSLLLVVALVPSPVAIAGSEEKRDLGTHVRDEVDSGVLYVDPLVSEESAQFSTAFYAGETRIAQASPERLNGDPDVRYALVSPEQYERLDRPHEAERVSAPHEIYFVEFTDRG